MCVFTMREEEGLGLESFNQTQCSRVNDVGASQYLNRVHIENVYLQAGMQV